MTNGIAGTPAITPGLVYHGAVFAEISGNASPRRMMSDTRIALMVTYAVATATKKTDPPHSYRSKTAVVT
jgi:hypothetical protein